MTLGSHQKTVGKSQTYITPRWILDALGPFDLDPCAAYPRPWDCAASNITESDDGLSQKWWGRVWLNPPFNRYGVGRWVDRMAKHGNGIALLHARTETEWFRPIWREATAILFLRERVTFCKADGSFYQANSGAPAVLASFGESRTLHVSNLLGAYVRHWDFEESARPLGGV